MVRIAIDGALTKLENARVSVRSDKLDIPDRTAELRFISSTGLHLLRVNTAGMEAGNYVVRVDAGRARGFNFAGTVFGEFSIGKSAS